MSNVLIEKQKIDILANAISDKSGVPVTMTLDEMVEAVDGIETGGGSGGGASLNLQARNYSVDSSGTETITADSGYDGLSSVTVNVPQMGTWESTMNRNSFETVNGTRYWKPDYGIILFPGQSGWIDEGTYSEKDTFYAVPANTTITPTTSAQTIGGANYMMEGAVTVSAVPSGGLVQTVTGSVTPNITVSNTGLIEAYGTGYTENVNPVYQSGYIDSSATLTVTAGASASYQLSTQAAKTVTPSTSAQTAVAAGKYTTGAVTVAAMPSGTAGTPSATKGTVSNHSISVTPSVTNTTGYITGGTKTGTAVTVSASELVSGSETKTANGTYNVTNLASLVVAVPIVTYYTGSSSPASSTGSNGDIYLQTT